MMQAATSTVVDAFFSKPFVNSFFTGKPLQDSIGVGTKWLFPEPKDVEGEFVICHSDIMEHEWVDAGLNQEQRVSVLDLIEVVSFNVGASTVRRFFDRSTPISGAIPH